CFVVFLSLFVFSRTSTSTLFPYTTLFRSVDGDYVYSLTRQGNLTCLKVADGSLLWQKDLRKEFAGRSGGWEYSESPTIDGEFLADRKSTRLNSSHEWNSYAVFCLKTKKTN